MAKTFKFEVYFPGELAAGLNSYSDTVEMTVHSFAPDEDTSDFEDWILTFLKEWYDGAGVEIVNEESKPSPASSEGEG
jgi:hypothetical protein